MVRRSAPANHRSETLVGSFVAAAIFQSLMQSAAAAGPPVLPTPCIGGPCGRNAGATPFVTSGVASAVISGNNLTVNQQSSSAILNWQNFNIGSGNSVTFNQPSATAAALNRIWSADPSLIAGALKANGQIYLLNQNGIVFANGAQVNVGSLTASTLDIADQTFLKGLLSNNTGDLVSGGILPPVFQQAAGAAAKGVNVESGATIQTADGGRVMLIGTTVNNAGKISTPDGQAILAAGTTVYLASTTDPSLRGLLIAVDSGEVAANSTATNSGTITAERGNVTLAGMVVNQSGRVTATTSVNANGSIYLVAGDADPNADSAKFYNVGATGFNAGQLMPNVGGAVNLAPGSVTEVQPDTTSTTTITNAQTFYPSQVSLVGKSVTLQGNAQITAPGGQVNLTAFNNPYLGTASASTNTLPAAADEGRVYLDSDSNIDVSGLQNVSAPASQNLVQIQLGANELQDDPLLRTGFLHGATVTVDLSKGTPLLNQATLNSYASTVGHSLQEVLTKGGSINLSSGGDVITRAGSVQNVSGGSIAFQNSSGATTKLLGANGKVYDIGSAPNDIQYIGFADSYSYTDPRWGTQTHFSASGTIAGYLQGNSAGTVSILSPNLYLAGKMLATTTPGPYQRSAATLPAGGSFNLGNASAAQPAVGNRNFDAPALNLVGSVADTLGTFDPTADALPAADTVDFGIGDLAVNGFNRFSIASNGTVVLPSTTHLQMAGNGSLAIDAAAVTLSGSIHSSGSAISLRSEKNLTGEDPTASSSITLNQNAVIDVSGNWINDSPLVTTAVGTSPTLWNGGIVSMQAAADSDVVLAAGSLVDVSGGGWVNSANKLTSGSGGSISIKSGGPVNPPAFALGGVSLLGNLRGGALASGGSLSITSAWVTVAGDPTGQTGELVLSPGLFTQGGFGSYSITGINGLTIGSSRPGAQELIQPLQQNLLFNGSMLLQKSAANLQAFTSLQTLPQEYRKPTSVSFASTLSNFGLTGAGDLTFNRGATIATDPGATVSLGARDNLTVSGIISAPAGTINLSLAPGLSVANTAADTDGYVAYQQLLITPSAQLLAPGYAAIYTDNPRGFRQGQVLSGGIINIVANKGSVVAQTGAIIDVSGAAGTVDLSQQNRSVVPTTVAGSAGSINIEAMSDIVLNSTLRGNAAGVPGATGGSLFVGLDKFNLSVVQGYNGNGSGASYPTGDRNLIVTSQTHLSDDLPVDSSGTPVDGVANVNAGTINAGGFDNVRLDSVDIVTFDGSPALTTRSTLGINAIEIAATPGSRASLNSAYVALGNSVYYPANSGESGRVYSPVLGDGTLSGTAGTIDLVGNSTLSGFQSASFSATNDIRLTYGTDSNDATDFTGSLKSSADLVFKAAQIYPTTGATFTINPADAGTDLTSSSSYSYAPGRVTILPVNGATAQTPLSALGTLQINSPAINQYGVLTAPFGQIQLNGIGANSVVALHAGSVTSVSAGSAVIPYGSTQNGRQWTYQVDNSGSSPTQSVLSQMPSKQVALNGSDVVLDPNSKVDVSGGGDLYAYEFIAGTGGSKDVLLPGNGYTYAIVPSLGSAFAPIDHQYSVGSNIAVGKQVYLSEVPGLAAGYYTLLPARYALFPGAFALSVVRQNSDILQNSAVLQPGGGYLVAGQFAQAGTNVLDSRTSTFLVASTAVVRSQSEYTDSYANSFFYNAAAANATNAVNLPADAGQLALSAAEQLHLQGTIGFAPAQFVAGKDSKGNNITVTGVGGTASIVASQIEVVAPGTAADGSLQLTAESLNDLGASVLILGATRVAGSEADTLNVGATSVTLANGSADPLTAPEIILAGTQSVSLDAGSAIKATGTSNDKTTIFNVAGDGALFRASADSRATVVRSGLNDTPAGTLQIASGTSIAAQSLILDAAANTQLDSGSNITAQNVEASSGRISLGDVPSGTSGLNVTSELLSNFKGLTDLSLRSASTIDFYGSVDLGTTGSDGKPTLQTVTFDAAALAGYGAGAKTVTAGSIVLLNSGTAQSSPPLLQTPDGTGQLTLTSLGAATGAPQVTLGAGSKTIAGFGGVTLAASSGDIRAMKTGSLTLTGAGDLTLSSARLSTDSAARQSIQNSTGSVTLASAGSAAALGSAGAGGQLSISGTAAAGSSAIVVSSLVALPSGSLNLQAQGGGDLTVTGTGQINAVGVVKPYYDTYAASDAGSVTLASAGGNVAVQSGAIIDVSGATSADGKVSSDAGSVSILAPQGQFLLAGALRGGAAAGQKGGDFALDTAGNADHSSAFSLSTLGLSSDGFTGSISIRDRNDSALVVDGTNRARSFSVTADAGTISVTGSVDTSGAKNYGGGDISLWAGHDLTLASRSSLTSAAGTSPNGNTLRGGNVTLGSAAGVITLASGSAIDLSGGAGKDNPGVNPDGQLRLQAAYNSATDTLGVNPIAASLSTTNPATVIVDAGWSYNNIASLGSFGDLTLGQIATDIQAFSAQAPGLSAGLTPTGAAFSVQVRPWITVSSPGDLTVSSVVDLHTLAANSNNGVPVDLTLRTGGNLLVNSSISDAFMAARVNAPVASWNLVAGDSANLQLAAGADLASANPLATQAGSGTFVLAPATLVRTGNGNINIAAGHEVCIGCSSDGTVSTAPNAQQAVIYTAGQPSTNGPATFTAPVVTTANVTPEFATDGGNITITSGGDITSAPTTNLVSNWLWRQGGSTPLRDTAWWVESSAFQEGVGALGGGNISVQAAGNITDLSVVIPTTGRVGVTAGTSTLSADAVVINGGGDLTVRAGGNVQGGLFEADLGYGAISTGGDIGVSASTGFAPVVVLADSSFALHAGGSVTLDGVLNSTFIPETTANRAGVTAAGLGLNRISYFYTYASDGALSITSAGGDVDLNNNLAGVLSAAGNATPHDGTAEHIITASVPYPATLSAAALSGDVTVGSALTLFPSSTGNLTVLADHAINLNGTLNMSEADSTQIGSLLAPINAVTGATALVGALQSTPLHAADPNPIRLVAATGDIVEPALAGVNIFPKRADIVAGGNITNLNVAGKNLAPSDVTVIQAGGDIQYDTTRDPVTNQLTANSIGIQVGGPGYVEAVAGGGIDLGDSDGIVTTGRLNDARLSATGATLVVAAGLGNNADGSLRLPSYEAFINKYLTATAVTSYAADLLRYAQSLFPTRTDLTASNALSVFQSLSRPQQLPFVSQVLTDELSATGLAHTRDGATYQRGFDTINTLFPTKDAQGNALTYKGDINMFFSQLKTALGGDIDLLAPGGSVVVGVPNPPQALNNVKGQPLAHPPISAESNLGLLVLAQGAIQGMANGDFDVNQSRVLTLQGGDIILWASTGSIDAGKGAKTAQGAPPPVIQTDTNGNIFVNPIGAVSGSGIGQLLTVQGIKAGLVNLIAPAGVVNAGEAGIRVAGDINIAATAVLNVGNIKVGGTATGLPVSDAGALSGALSGANSLGDAGKTVADQLTQSLAAGNNFQQLTDSLTPSFITVRMFCLGVQCDAQ